MNRLTYNPYREDNTYMVNQNKENYDISLYKCVDKLGKLEDIEDELGIDLITLFKAVMNGFWFKTQYDYHLIEPYEYVIDLESSRLIELYEENGHIFYFSDYGKTWALTREELENDK